MTADERSMTAAELLDVTEVRRLALGPEDTLVLTSPQQLSCEQFDMIREQFNENFPGTKVLVLEGGLELSVLKATE